MEKAEALTLSSAILERLKIAGFIDDLKFAQWFVAQRREGNKPKGDRAIRFELAGKGVSADLISEALKRDPEEAELDEKTLASVALERKKRSLMGLSKKELDAKITSFLSRRGFSWDTIKSVIREW